MARRQDAVSENRRLAFPPTLDNLPEADVRYIEQVYGRTDTMPRSPGQSEVNQDAAFIDEATGNMREGAMSLTARGAAMASDAMDAWRETVYHVRTAKQEYTERAYEVGRRRAEEAAFHTELGYEEAIDRVRQRPIAALSIAAGIGFLLGLVTARR